MTKKDSDLENSPLVSVIMPCFNSATTIIESLTSVVEQTYKNIEVIVVDDDSVDDSIEIVKENFPNARLFKNNACKKGVSSARNLGIEKANGHWVAFLDSDDIWMPDKLEKQIAQLGSYKWGHTDSIYFGHNQSGRIKRSDLSSLKSGDVFENLLLDNFITTSTVIAERQLLLEMGGFDVSFELLEDWKLWLAISKREPLSLCKLPLVRYRVTPGSASRRARYVYPYHKALISHSITDKDGGNAHLRRKALSNSNIICSYIAEDGKDPLYAILCALRGIYFQPLNLQRWKRPLSIFFNLMR